MSRLLDAVRASSVWKLGADIGTLVFFVGGAATLLGTSGVLAVLWPFFGDKPLLLQIGFFVGLAGVLFGILVYVLWWLTPLLPSRRQPAHHGTDTLVPTVNVNNNFYGNTPSPALVAPTEMTEASPPTVEAPTEIAEESEQVTGSTTPLSYSYLTPTSRPQIHLIASESGGTTYCTCGWSGPRTQWDQHRQGLTWTYQI